MTKFFNTAGFCKPEKHYMVPPFRGYYDEIIQLIEGEQYFLIHAPRQTGKTTFLHSLAHHINREGKYIATVASAESAGFQSISVEDAMLAIITSMYIRAADFLPPDEMPPDYKTCQPHVNLLQTYLSDWSRSQRKPVVLLLDEIDALYDDVLVSVLRQLRDGFQSRPKGFPQSIALVGLRDIREYKMKARADNPSLGSGSPFNVKTESFFLPVFSETEVRSLLQQRTDETGQVFEEAAIQQILEYGGGQPWLTNALAREITWNMLRHDTAPRITAEMVEQSKERLIERRDTHLDSLVDKLNEPRVRRIVTAVINGEPLLHDSYNDDLRYCQDLGIVAKSKPIRFANPIYKEIVVRLMNANLTDSFDEDLVQTLWYLRPDGSLDMDKLLQEFQKFYRENAEHWLDRFDYKEAGQQLLLMAFLQRIVNGGGRIEREMAVGSGRTDLAVFWQKQVFALELKLKRTTTTKERGLKQISQYCDTLGLQHGYLILFELKKSELVSWEERIRWADEDYEGKRITVVEM